MLPFLIKNRLSHFVANIAIQGFNFFFEGAFRSINIKRRILPFWRTIPRKLTILLLPGAFFIVILLLMATCFESNSSVGTSVDIVSLLCSEKNIALSFTTAEAELPVFGNRYKFEQMMLNLIRNAIDALEEKKEKTTWIFL